ncbi:MAG: hypothetical protein OEM21_10005, partial [Nitrosopumilus sp.]|nr:hypothetical protein [Nitrosopumilus sp.]
QVAEQQVAEQQVAEQQVAEQQVAEQQVAEQQVAEQQVAEQQVAEQQVVPNSLEEDFKQLEEKYAANSPRNAFASFIEKIDLTFKNLFWDQFEFTENKAELAHQAKIEALKEGQTSQQAMKVFQEEAATPLAEIIEFNEMLNVKYGFANQTIQDEFDENGKLSRTGE